VEPSFTSDRTPGIVVTMERRIYAAAASLQEAATVGPAVLFVESGALTVELDFRSPAPATLLRSLAGGQIARAGVSPGDITTLLASDALAMPVGAPYRTRNDERDPATVITVTIGEPQSPETVLEAHPAASTAGITDQILAGGGLVTRAKGSLTMAFGRATLAPGSEFPLHPTTGTELVAVDSGSLSLVLPQGSAWLNTPNHSAVTAHGYEDVPAGQGVAVAHGATVAYRNVGSSPLVVFVVTVEPAP
jgi:mannose-6-phosphate isomerase-like protein (cupin superfamily)